MNGNWKKNTIRKTKATIENEIELIEITQKFCSLIKINAKKPHIEKRKQTLTKR